MRTADVVILGGGVSGLALRSALPTGCESLLIEKDEAVGGLLRVHDAGKYVFDTTVHVLFFRSPEMKSFVNDLLPQGMHAFAKRNSVWQQGRRIRYPYQFNLCDAPPDLAERCLHTVDSHADEAGEDFRSWLLRQFGSGLYDFFFEPYNSKLYGCDPADLLAEPMVWTIPADNRQAIAAGAVPHCEAPARVDSFYPKGKEGISAIPRALLHAGKGEILTECAATAVFPDRRTVMTESGAMVKYTHLASSLPLPVLVGLIHDAPEAIKAAAANLSCQPVTVVEIGASSFGGNLSDHWVYFPEPEFPMYRLIRLEMISPDLAPEGGCSLLLECPGDRTPSREAVLSQLVDMGVLRDTKVDHYRTRTVQHAYVRFTHGYQESLLAIREYLAHIGISSVGRYGEWAYMNIEQAIQSGLAAGRSLSGVKEACGAGR